MRDELPKECRRDLDYRALIGTLLLLEGELVCLSILGLSSRLGTGGEPRITILGELRHFDFGWADGFAVGDGGRVLLHEPDFISGSLWTFDGNDFFLLTLRFGDVEFLIGDESGAQQEFTM
jgi:hypothetical protein